ncbi:MAG TPA: DMT family transporter [Frankiaceae bacterium]|nr:DMT family transporter [Frankiaceae bacterium]
MTAAELRTRVLAARPAKGVLAATGSATAFGVTIVVQRGIAKSGLPVTAALGVRFSIAAVVLTVFLLVRRASLVPQRGERVRALLLGFVGYAGEAALFYLALQRGSAAAVALLFYAYPAIVTLLEVALRLRPPKLVAFAVVVLSTLGAVLVVVTGDRVSISAAGVGFALAAATSFSVYMLLSQHLIRRSEPAVVGAYVAGGAGVSLLTTGLFLGQLRVPASDVAPLVLNGVATAVAFALLYTALAHLAAGAAAVVMTLEAFVAVALAALVLGESIRPLQLLGGVAIIAAAVLVAVAAKADVVDPDAPPVP